MTRSRILAAMAGVRLDAAASPEPTGPNQSRATGGHSQDDAVLISSTTRFPTPYPQSEDGTPWESMPLRELASGGDNSGADSQESQDSQDSQDSPQHHDAGIASRTSSSESSGTVSLVVFPAASRPSMPMRVQSMPVARRIRAEMVE